MAVFQYIGRNRKGERVKGKLKAANYNEAVLKMKEKGIAIRSLTELKGILYREINVIKPNIKHKDLVIYIRQFSTLIKAGISVVDSTKILAEQTVNRVLKQTLYNIYEDIQTGKSYTEAAEKFPTIFPSMFINMMKAGEASGQIEEILERMAVYFEKQHQTRQKMKAAMSYPIILAIISIAVVIFMLAVIVPKFAGMFASFNAKLPALTLWLLNSSQFVVHYFWLFILFLLLLLLGYYLLVRSKNGSFYLDMIKLKIPVLGKIIQKAALARMTRTLSTLFASSVPILHAISIVENVVGNQVIAKILGESKNYIEEGKSIAEPMKDHWAIPPLVSQMMIIGEQSGTIDYMLEKVAEFYESEVDQATEQLKSLLEPMMIVFLAGVVGTIVAAITIPMYSVFQNIQ
ncbi:type II secretion system F family protein [Bacillus sp. APMAM]|nr:type II secretion system F family protein [Bacillus sp. APMAM]RTZ56076.1 type II secretion system F family protein [Bacillus sp. SAJ1]